MVQHGNKHRGRLADRVFNAPTPAEADSLHVDPPVPSALSVFGEAAPPNALARDPSYPAAFTIPARERDGRTVECVWQYQFQAMYALVGGTPARGAHVIRHYDSFAKGF